MKCVQMLNLSTFSVQTKCRKSMILCSFCCFGQKLNRADIKNSVMTVTYYDTKDIVWASFFNVWFSPTFLDGFGRNLVTKQDDHG
jgi:hypothetical protein